MVFSEQATVGDSATVTSHAGVDDIIDTGITDFMSAPHTVLVRLQFDPTLQVGRAYVFAQSGTTDPVYGLRVVNSTGSADIFVDTIESGIANSYNIGTLPGAALAQPVFIGLLFSGTGWSLYYNGTIGTEVVSAGPDVTIGRFEIGGHSPTSDFFTGTIGGVEPIARVLTVTDIQRIETQTTAQVLSGDSVTLSEARYRITSQLNWGK